MKKNLLFAGLSLSLFACQAAVNSNIENKNSNANYNQNLEIEKIKQQTRQQSANLGRNLNSDQNQIEKGISNRENSNKQVNSVREKLHEINPENP